MEFGVSLTVNPTPVLDQSSALMNLNARDSDGWRSVYDGFGKASSGVDVNGRSAMGFPPLWRALNVISDDVAGLPCNVFRREEAGMGRDIDAEHPGERLLRSYNTTLNTQRLMKTVTAHAMLYGNGFLAVDRDTRKRPVDLAVLDPTAMVIRMVNGRLWYMARIDGEEVKIPAEDIIHIRGLCSNGIHGISVIEVMKDALGVGMAAMQFGGRFFGQGSNAGGLLMIPGSFTEEKIRNTMSAWEKMTEGLKRAHKVALIQDGVKYQQLTVNPDQAQFLETRQFEIRATVSNIFGIPPHMLGDDSRTSHNSLEQEDQNYLTRALNPWLKEWERELTQKLLLPRERSQQTHFVEFNREALIQMSFQDKVQGIAKQLETGVLNINEGRRLLNWPDIGPDGERRFRPANWVFLDAPTGANAVQTPTNQAIPQPNQPQNSKKEDTLRAMITSTVTKALTIERDRTVMAARDSKRFEASLDSFYSSWTEKFFGDLGWKEPGAVTAIQAHVTESRKQFENVVSVTTPGNLEAAVKDVVACWDDRGQILIERLCQVAQ